jgi:hypothetical protein
MKVDLYLRLVLTVIAAALVYLCVLLTPLPAVSAQAGRVVGAAQPGVSTGPAEMVVVGWRLPEALPVVVTSGDIRVTNETLRVTGRVLAEQPPDSVHRTALIGWEERGGRTTPGVLRPFDGADGSLPVVVRPPLP